MAYLSGYTKRVPITVDATKVGSGGVSDFPLLVPMTLPDDVAAACAFEDLRDLRFCNDEATVTYPHELVSGSKSGKTLQAWVLVPSILSSSNTTIYAQVGNAAATMPSAAEQAAVWAANYIAATLGQVSGPFIDSAGHIDGTNNLVGIGNDGKVGLGKNFNTPTLTGDNIDFGKGPYASPTDDFSVGLWAKVGGQHNIIGLTNRCDTSGLKGWALCVNSYYTYNRALNFSAGKGLLYQFGLSLASETNAVPIGEWFHARATFSTTQGSCLYLNGTRVGGPVNASGVIAYSGVESLRIGQWSVGRYSPNNSAFNQFRLDSFRGDSWVLTEYNNQSSPSTFSKWGPLETAASLYVPHRNRIIYRSGPSLRGVIH